MLALLTFVVASGTTCMVVPPPGNGNGNGVDVNEILRVKDDDHAKGAADAPITVIEYADFQCPVCRNFFLQTYPTIETEFINTNQVRWVFRHFPLRSIHPCAEASSRGSECAHDQGMFWEFHDRLFNSPNQLCNDDLKLHAQALGLDSATFDSCIDNRDKAARVQRDFDEGVLLGITGTPTFFINGRKVVGFRSVEEFRAELGQ
ncbi:MAG: DsbA family protein [Phycisphaerae bacterium]|nr:DsbA family protein [Phycisphaerae bacterium]NUQ44436.1 DsbA family protein [Phycisphaerae bacterium]